MSLHDQHLLSDLLKEVSRSFYLTLRVLPTSVRAQIGLAYLLARSSDTIADTELIPVAERMEALQQFNDRVLGARAQPIDFSRLAVAQPQIAGGGTNAERVLLQSVEPAISLLRACSPADMALIQTVVARIVSGQRLDLERFGHAKPGSIVSLRTEAELDDYTYRVAGCVGEFWTKICRAHVFPDAHIDEPALLADAGRFGKGLQLINILRDLPRDLLQGRCYIPADSLAEFGLQSRDLLESRAESHFRPLYDHLLDRAWSHIEAGWRYTNALPRACVRVRLACAWPILIGAQTIRLLRIQPVLGSTHRVKISRREVRRIVAATILSYPWQRHWHALFQKKFS